MSKFGRNFDQACRSLIEISTKLRPLRFCTHMILLVSLLLFWGVSGGWVCCLWLLCAATSALLSTTLEISGIHTCTLQEQASVLSGLAKLHSSLCHLVHKVITWHTHGGSVGVARHKQHGTNTGKTPKPQHRPNTETHPTPTPGLLGQGTWHTSCGC